MNWGHKYAKNELITVHGGTKFNNIKAYFQTI